MTRSIYQISRLAAAILIFCSFVSCSQGEGAACVASPGDSAAVYACALESSLGGRSSWDGMRYVSFRWIVERDGEVLADREHSWDRYEGTYRIAFEREGVSNLSIFNVQELREVEGLGSVPSGRAWRGGAELEGSAVDSTLRTGYATFINDTYWALMPWKWQDPGVHLEYEGTRTLADGADYPAIRLSFDEGLGVTEDVYWGYIDPGTGLLAAWQYHLDGNDAPGDVIWWSDWEEIGGIQFATTRRRDSGERFIYFEDVVFSETVPAGRFDPPLP